MAAGVALALVASTFRCAGADDGTAGVPTLTLQEAMSAAFERSPRLRFERARVEQAEGALVEARTYPFNPQLEIEAGARSGSGHSTDRGIELSQELEIAGQRARRMEVGAAELDAARSKLRRRQRLLAAEVRVGFLDALAARDRLTLARDETRLARQLVDLTRRKLGAGAATRLDTNVAAADFGRTEQAEREAAEAYALARAMLAQTIGLDPATLPVPEGELIASVASPPPLAELLAAANRYRSDLEAWRDLRRASRARVELARASAWPNVVVGGFARHEEGTDTIVGGRLVVPLPLFQRNQGEIARAGAAARSADAELEAAGLDVSREVVTAYESHRAASESLRTLREAVLGATEENLDLLERTFDAGKIGWADVLVMRRALFDVRRAFLETTVAVERAAITIDLAAGRMPLPTGVTSELE